MNCSGIERDANEYVLHAARQNKCIIFERAQGWRLWDIHGKEYLDTMSGSAGVAGLASETLACSSEKTNAALALRLVTKDGDVVWATTEESTGNRIKGPAADLADRAVKHLIRDIEKALPAAR